MAIPFEEGKVHALAPHLFLRAAVDNSLWADLGDGAVVVDALEEPALAPVIQQAITETTGKPLRWVVFTHWHGDHTACNRAWAKEGATLIAHAAVGPATTARDGRPDVTFQDHYTLQGAERSVAMEWVGGTHTAEDTAIYFPWAKVLHVGDLFGWGLIPLRSLAPESIARLRAVYARLLEFDAEIIVPGHGPTLTPDHLRRFLAYFEALVQQVPPLCRAGRSPAEIERALPPPEEMRDWWRFVAWKHARNLQQLCRATTR